MMRPLRLILAVLAAFGMLAAGPARSEDKVGVVLMHGKWALPQAKTLLTLSGALQSAGYLVWMPTMPWAGSRLYDKSYEDALREIDAAVVQLKAQGATRIVVAGHSIGASAALAYGARRDGLLGIVAIAPGHMPEIAVRNPGVAQSLGRADAMLAAGKGDDTDEFLDLNQGQTKTIRTTASIYLSYARPDGPAVMPINATHLKAPLLWVVGSGDGMSERGEAYAFAKAPANPHNRYQVLSANHMSTPTAAAQDIIAWIDELKRAP